MRLCLKPCRATVPFLSVLALCLAAGASAQQITQKVTGPKARYWLSAETASGMPGLGAAGASSGGLGAMMGALTGMGGGSRRNLLLELGSVQGPVGGAADPVGDHSIPGGMGMGASLPLLSPERSGPPQARRSDERDVPEQREQPEGNARMLFFWGCGENAGADQPVVLDMKQIMDGKLPPSMASYNVNMGPTGPQFGRDRSYMAWPNRKDSQAVPATSSMVGDHLVMRQRVTRDPLWRAGQARLHGGAELVKRCATVWRNSIAMEQCAYRHWLLFNGNGVSPDSREIHGHGDVEFQRQAHAGGRASDGFPASCRSGPPTARPCGHAREPNRMRHSKAGGGGGWRQYDDAQPQRFWA
ncbi:MAG: hypothetical protein IPG42_19575 [Betaproteobacteria bacterium]|nr:hypothetical protein [Betaproteobacteria bacterium]